MNVKKIIYELFKLRWRREHLAVNKEIGEYIMYIILHGTDISYDEFFEKENICNCNFEEFIDLYYYNNDYIKILIGYCNDDWKHSILGDSYFTEILYEMYLLDIEKKEEK